MNKQDRDRWQSEVLDQVLLAFAGSGDLAQVLIFKGARVLARRLPAATRQSLDIDSNLTEDFVKAHPDRSEQQSLLKTRIEVALKRHFERGSPVRYELVKVSVDPHPPHGHPKGWNAFKVKLTLKDLQRPTTLGLPAPIIDIAAPEHLPEGSVEPLVFDGGGTVNAYTLVRQAGEKLRAFLTSLPTYRRKIGGRDAGAIRARDLYDLAKIARQHPVPDDETFWSAVGHQFKDACETRFVDCTGISSFRESWAETTSTYRTSGVFENDVPLTEVEGVLERLVEFYQASGVLPFEYPLPPDSGKD